MTTPNSPTTVEAFSFDVVTQILDDEKLNYRMDEQDGAQILRTGFLNAAISIASREDELVIESMWRGSPTTDMAAKVLAATNEWNLSVFAPTLRFFETESGSIAINALRQLLLTAGVSYNQVGAFIMTTLEATFQCFAWLEEQFPELVTWEAEQEDDHEH